MADYEIDLSTTENIPPQPWVPRTRDDWTHHHDVSTRARLLWVSLVLFSAWAFLLVISVIANWLSLDDALKLGGIVTPISTMLTAAAAFYFKK